MNLVFPRLQAGRLLVAFAWPLICLGWSMSTATAQLTITPTSDMELDPSALVMGTRDVTNGSINGRPFQQEALVTFNGYQFAAWYHQGGLSLRLGRRSLDSETWEVVDTGFLFQNGAQFWDSHNCVSMGISGDGRIHLVFDLHSDVLRYVTTELGYATSSSAVWAEGRFVAERNSLNPGEPRVPGGITYPRLSKLGGGDLAVTFREGGAPNGEHLIAAYDSNTGLWGELRTFIDGDTGTGVYDDVQNDPSPTRNSYHNGFHVDLSGRLHTTWTWREGPSGANHDIHYAYSDDRGMTWRNTFDQLIGAEGLPITLISPGIEIVDLDRRQALINQQGQIVDQEGGVHVLAYHRRQEPGFEWQPGDGNFFRGDSAYHHYYRNPVDGQWQAKRFPNNTPVGSRPRVTVDASGNLYGLYTQGSQLFIAGAEKISGGYSDWQILHRETRHRFDDVTPLVDNQRLLDTGILSVFIQVEPTNPQPFTATSSSLRVLEFSTLPPPPVPPVPPSALVAGWERYASTGVSAPTQTDGVTTGTTAKAGFGLDSTRRARTDGTWGSLETPPADATDDGVDDAAVLLNGAEGYFDFTITDTSGTDRALTVFHFDSATFRPRSSRDFTLSVIAGDLTVGTVASDIVPTVVGGQMDWSDFDIRLDFLDDNVLDANGSVTFRLEFTGGSAGAGGHHQYLDNVAITAAVPVGDFDDDGDVDLADLDRYSGNVGADAVGELVPLDLDGDGVVGANDFSRHYGELVETSNGRQGTFAGDVNLDGKVDVLGDAFALVRNLGAASASWSQGDLNADGVVDVLGDAFLLVRNLGNNNADE